MSAERQFLKYIAVAAASATADWVAFVLCLAALGMPVAAQGVSRIVGGVVSFTLNKFWSFQSREAARILGEARRFVILFGASYLLSLVLFSTLAFAGMHPYWAKLGTDTFCFFFNFVAMRCWVYRRPDRTVDAPPRPVTAYSAPRDRPMAMVGGG